MYIKIADIRQYVLTPLQQVTPTRVSSQKSLPADNLTMFMVQRLQLHKLYLEQEQEILTTVTAGVNERRQRKLIKPDLYDGQPSSSKD